MHNNNRNIFNTSQNEDFRYMIIHIFALRWRDEIKSSSQLRALHRYRRGHGFKSRTGLKFFSGPIYNYSFQ